MNTSDKRKQLQQREQFLKMDISENQCRLKERRTTVEGMRISRQNIEYAADQLAVVRTELTNLAVEDPASQL